MAKILSSGRRRGRLADPTPVQIAAACAAIRAGWTPPQRRKRDVRVSRMGQTMIRQLAEWVLPPPPKILGKARLGAFRTIPFRSKTARTIAVPNRRRA